MEEIENPQLWRLTLGIESNMLHALLWSTVADGGLQYSALPVGSTAAGGSYRDAIKETIYANPWLLADYDSVAIAIGTDAYTLIDDAIDSHSAADIANLAGDSDNTAVMCDNIGHTGIVWTADDTTIQFLRRTFRNPSIQHMLAPLCKYLCKRRSNRTSIYAHLHRNTAKSLDILVTDHNGRLRMLTSKVIGSDNDALYFLMSVARLTGFDAENDELLLCGDNDLRHSLGATLSPYVRHVLPLIFPSAALRGGRDAFKAPFPLVILPLCE